MANGYYFTFTNCLLLFANGKSLRQWQIATPMANRANGMQLLASASSYSVLKFFTGFVNAALIACELIVSKAMTRAIIAATRNTHH